MQGEPPRGADTPGESRREPDATAPKQGDAGTPTRAEASEQPSEWEKAQLKRRKSLIIRVVLGLLLLTLFVVFVSLNSHSVRVHFIFTETTTPLVWVFLICALIGGLVAFLLGRSGRKANRKYIKELERRLDGRGRGQ